MPEAKTIRSITGRQTTAGAAEETLQLSLDGAAAANTIAVANGSVIVISDWVISAAAAGNFRLQMSTDGVAFTDLALWRQPADGSGGMIDLGTGIRVAAANATTSIRCRAETPGGAAAVTTTIRAYTEA